MLSLNERLRAAARAALPEGAFLRRDRGEALFVTDAPRLRPEAACAQALRGAGFFCERRDRLLCLSPGPEWLVRLEADHPDPPDAFSRSLFRFAGLAPEEESLCLFALGARILDGDADDGRFERRLRQRTATCLRLNTPTNPCGGGLYACALLRHIIKEVSL